MSTCTTKLRVKEILLDLESGVLRDKQDLVNVLLAMSEARAKCVALNGSEDDLIREIKRNARYLGEEAEIVI